MKKLRAILESSKGGDCYRANANFLLDLKMSERQALKSWKLVHGIAIGRGPIAGLEFGHCWLEKGDKVYDFSNGKNIVMPKELYYALGNIKDTAGKLIRYTPEQVFKKAVDTGQWGPWDLKTPR